MPSGRVTSAGTTTTETTSASSPTRRSSARPVMDNLAYKRHIDYLAARYPHVIGGRVRSAPLTPSPSTPSDDEQLVPRDYEARPARKRVHSGRHAWDREIPAVEDAAVPPLDLDPIVTPVAEPRQLDPLPPVPANPKYVCLWISDVIVIAHHY